MENLNSGYMDFEDGLSEILWRSPGKAPRSMIYATDVALLVLLHFSNASRI